MDAEQFLRQEELIPPLKELRSFLRAFGISLSRRRPPMWVADLSSYHALREETVRPIAEPDRALSQVVETLRAIEYVDGQNPQGTRKLPGVIALPPDLMHQ